MVVRYRETPTDPWSILNPGPRGKSAYEVAVDAGFVGTEQEWLDSITANTTVVTTLDAGETRPVDLKSDSFVLRKSGEFENLVTNPSGRKTSGTVTVRENVYLHPLLTSVSDILGYPAGSGGTATDSVSSDAVMGNYARMTWTAAPTTAQNSGFHLQAIPVVAGQPFSFSALVRSSISQVVQVFLQFWDANNATVGGGGLLATTPIVAGQPTLVSAKNAIAPAGAVALHVLVYGASQVSGSTTWSVGDTFDISKILVEKSSTIGDYFDGTTLAAGDFTYAWSGTANASTSKQWAPIPEGWSSSASATVYYSVTREKVAVMAEQTGGDMYVTLPYQYFSNGVPFTLVTDYELPPGKSVRIRGYQLSQTDPSTVELPWELHSGSGTYRSTATSQTEGTANHSAVALVVNSPDVVAGDTMYVRSMIVEGDYDGPYFDGNLSVANWTGTPDASTSTLILPALSIWDGTQEIWATGDDTKNVTSVNGQTGTVTLAKSDVGLSNVDNTSDVNKPISTATQTALNLKAPLASPTFTGTVAGITKTMVGLGSVDNTSDLAKPISTATQTALNLKAPLASPTFTGTVTLPSTTNGLTKTNVGLGNVDNTSDANKPVSSATQTALNLKANLASPTFTGTVSGITKSMVGLANVDNTSDASKPVSTAQQTALNLKANIASPTFTGTVSGITATMVGLGNVPNVDATLRSNHTGTQTVSTLSDFTTYVGAKVLVLGPTDPVPGGTAAGTVIIRTET